MFPSPFARRPCPDGRTPPYTSQKPSQHHARMTNVTQSTKVNGERPCDEGMMYVVAPKKSSGHAKQDPPHQLPRSQNANILRLPRHACSFPSVPTQVHGRARRMEWDLKGVGHGGRDRRIWNPWAIRVSARITWSSSRVEVTTPQP